MYTQRDGDIVWYGEVQYVSLFEIVCVCVCEVYHAQCFCCICTYRSFA